MRNEPVEGISATSWLSWFSENANMASFAKLEKYYKGANLAQIEANKAARKAQHIDW